MVLMIREIIKIATCGDKDAEDDRKEEEDEVEVECDCCVVGTCGGRLRGQNLLLQCWLRIKLLSNVTRSINLLWVKEKEGNKIGHERWTEFGQ